MDRLNSFHKTKQGYLVFGFGELTLAYVFASIAIDTANMWAYLATIILFIGSILNFINATKSQIKSRKRSANRQ